MLVTALEEMDDVEVHVVAPAGDMTGQSDNKTPGGATFADGATISGVEGTAVDGFPADTITVALDELGLEPGPRRVGDQQGPERRPAGLPVRHRRSRTGGRPARHPGHRRERWAERRRWAISWRAELIVEQIEEHRDELSEGTADTDAVVNINVPECTAGAAKELLEVALATEIPEGVNPFAADCTVEPATRSPPTTSLAVAAGYSALSLVPPEAPAG